MTAVASPTDIERAIEFYLVARVNAFKAAKRQQNMRHVFADPAATVACFEGTVSKIGQRAFRVICPVHIQLSMTNAKGEEARRDGINPLVIGVFKALSRQRFDLDITDLLPVRFRDVTTDEDFKNNKIIYDLEFTTSFCLDIGDDPEAVDLLAVGLNYFLQPDDGNVDAVDQIVLQLLDEMGFDSGVPITFDDGSAMGVNSGVTDGFTAGDGSPLKYDSKDEVAP